MSFSFAEFLLSQTKQCNGHLQAEAKGISIEEGLEICRELEELTNHEHSFTIELWTDCSYTIYEVDYWEPQEHILGHRNRIILGVSP